jgi:hypothetical protein
VKTQEPKTLQPIGPIRKANGRLTGKGKRSYRKAFRNERAGWSRDAKALEGSPTSHRLLTRAARIAVTVSLRQSASRSRGKDFVRASLSGRAKSRNRMQPVPEPPGGDTNMERAREGRHESRRPSFSRTACHIKVDFACLTGQMVEGTAEAAGQQVATPLRAQGPTTRLEPACAPWPAPTRPGAPRCPQCGSLTPIQLPGVTPPRRKYLSTSPTPILRLCV